MSTTRRITQWEIIFVAKEKPASRCTTNRLVTKFISAKQIATKHHRMQILSTRAQYKLMCPSPLFLELRPLCRRSTILLKTLTWILKAGRRKYLDLTDIWFHFGPRAKVFWNFRRVQILVDTLKEKKIELLCERSKEKKMFENSFCHASYSQN